ncbi:MAG: processing protein [Petroclostridium sp.]|jgi:DNA processing protein|uniref:DNA-processing protein DprA n=1 Tax=Petroclostridium xylanilyticum TaxID=1792311 RepID=UPI000B98192C|nr:DNA-processing protein DprA [Petroclostridium xylanilyticum]MBZ4645043.1 hypothetical protein [Clostridia bacterium]MDK2810321.1 processing protein [Petroclostridium sp.]
MEELKYWLWLTSIPGIGSIKISKILQVFQNPKEVWNASKSDLKCVDVLNDQDIANISSKNLDKAEKIFKDISRLRIDVITIRDERYPERLRNIYDPPGILYVKGELPSCNIATVAVIGSRKASPYGINIAEKLSYQLAQRDIIIVSGAARGIDTSAHRGALKAGKKTVAVLGCGVDIVYPRENAELMRYIEKSGAIISEYPPGTHPSPANFPARNRIISGLSCGVIVVEAGEKSGSLITVDFALEQGRDVFAVPGNIDSLYSKGSNNLIKQGAKIVTCIEDILEELPINNMELCNTNNSLKSKEYSMYGNLSDEEKVVISHLSTTPVHIDELCRNLEYSVQKINAILTLLEMKGLISQIPGKYFVTTNQF